MTAGEGGERARHEGQASRNGFVHDAGRLSEAAPLGSSGPDQEPLSMWEPTAAIQELQTFFAGIADSCKSSASQPIPGTGI